MSKRHIFFKLSYVQLTQIKLALSPKNVTTIRVLNEVMNSIDTKQFSFLLNFTKNLAKKIDLFVELHNLFIGSKIFI